MAVQLKKGQKVNLTKGGAGLKRVRLGLGWDTNRYDGGGDFDLDLVVFVCDENKKVLSDRHLVFYGSEDTMKSPDDGTILFVDPEHAVVHSPDNRTGAGDGDDEWVDVEFDKLAPNARSIIAGVCIYEAGTRNQTFGLVENSYIRIVDKDTGEETHRFDLGEDFSIEKSVVFGELYKVDGDWKFNPIGAGYDKELVDFCNEYGVNVQ